MMVLLAALYGPPPGLHECTGPCTNGVAALSDTYAGLSGWPSVTSYACDNACAAPPCDDVTATSRRRHAGRESRDDATGRRQTEERPSGSPRRGRQKLVFRTAIAAIAHLNFMKGGSNAALAPWLALSGPGQTAGFPSSAPVTNWETVSVCCSQNKSYNSPWQWTTVTVNGE